MFKVFLYTPTKRSTASPKQTETLLCIDLNIWQLGLLNGQLTRLRPRGGGGGGGGGTQVHRGAAP